VGVIRVLEEEVANQIAAGEVVERPASVVKELVENALDAGASRIDVEIEGGGAERIRIADDGCGMEPEDARLAFARHATSKIRSASDLASIRSFGFRGEALPSIASVARVTLTTAPAGSAGASRLTLDAGGPPVQGPAAHPRGTTVEVEGLFRHAPARRKFLRSQATETARIGELLAVVAAAHPGVAFGLRSGGRSLANWPAVPALRDRVAQILGERDARPLLDVAHGSAPLRLAGLTSPPALQRATSRDQHLYVNGRPVRDRRLLHAVQEAYVTVLPKGRYPLLYLFLEVDPAQVDVNVHPAKTEVRFLRAGAVHDLVREGLRQALGGGRPFYLLGHASGGRPFDAFPVRLGEVRGAAAGAESAGVDEVGEGAEMAGPPPATDAALLESLPLAPLAQFRDTYILASAPDGLVIVDQHAAHERVLYERFLQQADAGRTERQRLLFPEILEVSPAQRQASENSEEALRALGFTMTAFGKGAVKIEEVPVLVGAAPVGRLVLGLLDEILEWDRSEGIARLRERIAATAACHAAVRAHHPLTPEEMRHIVTELMRGERSLTCPHGRPSLLRLPLDQLEREFRRR
jgi:DNA mismatch repair protein MutL